MQICKKMYLKLFNAVKGVLKYYKRADERKAIQSLQQAQLDVEKIHISAEAFYKIYQSRR